MLRSLFFITMSGLISACGSQGQQNNEANTLSKSLGNQEQTIRQVLGQKIMLDLRYYCAESTKPESCREPLVALPPELAQMIAQYNLGGVILFSENLQSIGQIVELNEQLQRAASQSASKQPLFISIDQEGGRVARLPREVATAFSGNMAIGATAPRHGDKYATLSGDIIGKELVAAGFNVNHAPTVDVNINPDNPVINVRSFGEDPKQVATLALAQMKAMQKHNIIATLKHFPGHGDTNVDSHTGLPRVEHTLAQVNKVDLAPFKYAIDNNAVSMIMTAHIQYPQLDDSTFVSKSGAEMMKPATMSRAILHDLLRTQMGFEGIVITDALDMKGISDFFTESQAVIETFKAGADIALMPIKIRNKAEIKKLESLMLALESAVDRGELNRDELTESYQRITKVKATKILPYQAEPLDKKVNRALAIIGRDSHKSAEQALADDSITVIKGTGTLPKGIKTLQVFMPDEAKCEAMLNALDEMKSNFRVKCSPYFALDETQMKQAVAAADAVIAASVTPKQSLVEMGGMDDLARLRQELGNLSKNKRVQDNKLATVLEFANKKNKHIVFVSLRMPYEAARFGQYADSVVATYSYNQHLDYKTQKIVGCAYRSIAKLVTGNLTPSGVLPVTVQL